VVGVAEDELAEDIDHPTATSLAGSYLHTLATIVMTSSSGRGGSHRLLFVTSNAASISFCPIPRLRIVPARLINVLLRWPSGMISPIAPLPFAYDFCVSRNRRRSHLGVSAIGAPLPSALFSSKERSG
jgi:hypothetical protein